MISERDHDRQLGISVIYPDGIADRYRELLTTLSRLLRPVLDRVYTCRPQELESELEELARRLREGDIPHQHERAVRVSLMSVELQARIDVSGRPPTPWQLKSMLDMLERRAPDLVCDLLISRELLLWRLIADNWGLQHLPQADLYRLLGRLEGLMLDRQLWHVLAMWAFRHRDRALLERAYESFLTQPGSSLNQALWQRVNLLHLLLDGRATTRDVLETVSLFSVHPQVEEFCRVILPACIEAGIADARVQELVTEKIRILRGNGYAWAGDEARTKSLRTRTV